MRYRLRRQFNAFFHGMDIARRVILGILFWASLLLVVLLILFGGGRRSPGGIRSGSILVLHPFGSIVESYTRPATYQGLPVSGYPNETLLSDLLDTLRFAADDNRIVGVWLYLDDLYTVGPAAAGELAEALREFRESGKKIVATADTFNTSRYRIAAPADLIVVDRLGEVFPTGYGYWRGYYAEGLERLGADARLFRSGESKTGAENFVLDGMSEAARRNEQRLLGDLWTAWLEEVSSDRDMDSGDLDEWIQNYDRYLIESGGDGSAAALERGLVDAVETGGVVEGIIEEQLAGGDSLPSEVSRYLPKTNRIDSFDYLMKMKGRPGNRDSVAVIPISGALVYGEGGAGTAGSVEITGAIERARMNRDVKAIVLRIDNPGGDVRAGEEIRRTVEETRRDWDMPVVASMGDLAASGGYWIAVESDLILTRRETITGSIGVYSLSVTFEQALSLWLGIRIDGWGTTPWSAMANPGRALDERAAALYAASVQDIDMMFRRLVSEKRNLGEDTVRDLAGGIPWSGKRALEYGLADREGGLNDAVAAARELADDTELQVLYFDSFLDPREEMLNRLMWGASAQRRLFRSGLRRGYRN